VSAADELTPMIEQIVEQSETLDEAIEAISEQVMLLWLKHLLRNTIGVEITDERAAEGWAIAKAGIERRKEAQ
jgi:hypothetical protein